MDFAQRELEKYGWIKGKGLGKMQSGVTEALKPKVKLNKVGIGYDIAKDHTDHWWEKSFNNAASNIKIELSESEVSIKASKNDSSKKKKKNLYFGFVQKGTNTAPLREDPVEEPEEEIAVSKLTDEELFEACGRRTSHKAARHGLNLSGKLARLKQQEEEALLATETSNRKIKRKKENKDKDAKRSKS